METVSVVIPVYNRANVIGRCLESVLRQTYRAVEIIVVDDGSTDNLSEMVQPVWNQIHLIRQPNRGQGAARNAGIKAAKGGWVAFLDSDDLWEEKKLEIQMRSILSKGYEWGHTKAAILPQSENQRFFGDWFHGNRNGMVAQDLLQTNFICTSSVLIKKQVLDQVGGFSEDREIQNFEDYELWLRIAAMIGIDYVDIPLTLYTTESMNRARQESVLRQIEKNEEVMKKLESLPFSIYSSAQIKKRRFRYQQHQFQQALMEGDQGLAKAVLNRMEKNGFSMFSMLTNRLLVDSPPWLLNWLRRIYYQFFKRAGI
jgi:glycosyltransferase involved in cell wall biosynthesis